ncbi:hypothetical protein, partial [Streptomyces noursei]
YLYSLYSGDEANDFTPRVVAFPITRRTAKRVYYLRGERNGRQDIGFVDRQELETNGEAHRRARYALEEFTTLYASPPELPGQQHGPEQGDLKALKQAMAEAHPDRGGTREKFAAARAAYVRARGRLSVGCGC